jgi:uncharacterized membrane protein YdjX (TVP38/TMEM64 family)
VAARRGATAQRLFLLAVAVVGLLILARLSGIGTRFTAAGLRETIQGAGIWGALAFIGVFALGQLVHVPGLVFYVASVFAFGRAWGGVLSYVASLVSVSVSFAFVRTIGGQPLGTIKSPRIERLLSHLEERPLTIMLLLRTVLWTAPALNYTLALSSVRFPQYFASAAVGLILPIAAISVLYGTFFH